MAAHSVTWLPGQNGEQDLLVACLKEDRVRRFALVDERLVPHPLGTFTPPPAPGPAIWHCTRTTAISIASTNSMPPSVATTGRRTDR
jgi:hypothetical protein